jgi:uncharacterized protein
VLAVIYLSACAFFYLQQDQMTFPAPADYARTTPLDVGIPFEDLYIPVNGSEQIHVWWIPAATASDKVLLVFHGNGYVLDQAARGELAPLHGLGTNLVMIDYRGYGPSSPGTPNEKRVYEDARAAFSYRSVQRRIASRDRLTPPAMAQALFQKANEPKQLYLSPGANHDDMMSTGVTAQIAQINEFLQTIH